MSVIWWGSMGALGAALVWDQLVPAWKRWRRRGRLKRCVWRDGCDAACTFHD